MRVRLTEFLALGGRLATHPEGPVDAYGLARELGIPPSTAAGWIRQLRFHRALFATEEGEHVDRPRLHAFYTAHRVARLDPVAEIGTDMTAQDLAALLERQGIPYVVGMISAANRWAFYEDHRDVQLYVERRDVPTLRARIPTGRNRLQLFAERLEDLPRARRGIEVTDAFLTMIDCRAHPDGGAHADFLERNVLRRTRA